MKNAEIVISTKNWGIKKSAHKLSKLFECLIPVDEDDTLWLPQKIGEGYVQFFEIEPGLSFLKCNFKFNEEITFVDNARKDILYTIRFLSNETTIQFIAGNDFEYDIGNKYGISAFYSSTHASTKFHCPANTWITAIWIAFEPDWLIKNCRKIDLDDYNEAIAQDILNSKPLYGVMKLGIDALKMVEEWIKAPKDTNQNKILLKGKVLLLLSLFLKKIGETANHEKRTGYKEATNVIEFIEELTLNVNKPWPKINDAAARCMLSQSKFIRVFNEIYKKNYYEYYRELRMEKAANYLSKGYSVFETAISTGFLNVSHFTSEFKKYFLVEPRSYNKN